MKFTEQQFQKWTQELIHRARKTGQLQNKRREQVYDNVVIYYTKIQEEKDKAGELLCALLRITPKQLNKYLHNPL